MKCYHESLPKDWPCGSLHFAYIFCGSSWTIDVKNINGWIDKDTHLEDRRPWAPELALLKAWSLARETRLMHEVIERYGGHSMTVVPCIFFVSKFLDYLLIFRVLLLDYGVQKCSHWIHLLLRSSKFLFPNPCTSMLKNLCSGMIPKIPNHLYFMLHTDG